MACAFEQNLANDGGAILLKRSSALIEGCDFRENIAFDDGGGIACWRSAEVRITDCDFVDNQALDKRGAGVYCLVSSVTIGDSFFAGGRADNGGGIFGEDSSVVVRDTRIRGNEAYDRGGGIHFARSRGVVKRCSVNDNVAYDHGGGGIYVGPQSAAIVDQSLVSKNTAHYFGGGGVAALGCSLSVTNSVVAGNATGSAGSGLFVRSAYLTLSSSTIAGNGTAGTGGGLAADRSACDVFNSIIWANLPDGIVTLAGESPNVEFSDVQGGWGGEGNFSAEPEFVDPGSDNYHLSGRSPCVDVGDMMRAPSMDFDGESRPQGSGVDVGADERLTGLVHRESKR